MLKERIERGLIMKEIIKATASKAKATASKEPSKVKRAIEGAVKERKAKKPKPGLELEVR